MGMSFSWGADIGVFLFPGLKVQSVWGCLATCFVVALMAFVFELLRYLQAKKRQRELILRSKQLKTICSSESATLLTNLPADRKNVLNITFWDKALLFGGELSLWFSLQNLAYILMLAVMAYNGWLLIAAAIGGGLGYFVFGQKFMKVNLQNCAIIRDTFCMQKCGVADDSRAASTADGESTPALETPTSSRGLISCHSKVVVNVHTDAEAECDST